MGLLSGAARLARGKVGEALYAIASPLRGRTYNRPLANFASDLMRPMGGGAAAQSPNAQALQGLTQRLAARMPEGSSDAAAAIPSRVTAKDELLMRLMMDKQALYGAGADATDDEIIRALRLADAEDPLSLARRYRERYAYHMGPNPRTWGT